MLALEGLCEPGTDCVKTADREALERTILKAREMAYRTPCFHELSNQVHLLTGLMRVLGASDLFVHPRRFIRIGLPHDLAPSLTTALHQDYRYVQGAVNTLTLWIPLGACDTANGTLILFPETHKQGLLPVTERAGNSFAFDVSRDGLPNPVYAEVQEGDAVIFHSLTVHGASENRSDRVRLSMDVRVQRADDPLCSSALLAPYPISEGQDNPGIWSKDPFYCSPVNAKLLPFRPYRDVKSPGTRVIF